GGASDQDGVAHGAAHAAADGVGAAVADERVVALATVHDVVAGAAHEGVVAIVAVDVPVGGQEVVAGAAVEGDPDGGLDPGVRHDGVVALVAVDGQPIQGGVAAVDPHVVA